MDIIYCKDCKYCDTGINEEGKLFYKCLSGHNYGGTKPDDFCSHAIQKDKRQETIKELNQALICGLVCNRFTVPVTIDTIANTIKLLEEKNDKC